MKTTIILLSIGLVWILGMNLPAQEASYTDRDTRETLSLETLAKQAVSENQEEAARAIATLRTKGPEGLEILFNYYADLLKPQPLLSKTSGEDSAKLNRLKAVLDTVGQQRDCYASYLYWYTDFNEAKAAAKTSDKPILSLRLLGKLNEEFSCTNSRFFRTTLYSNAEVSKYLRDHFILHWESVRPVPKVTIDFGDGRKLEQTITGNSIHYVLDADGHPIDALPGLYGAKAFLRGIAEAEKVAKEYAIQTVKEREIFLSQYHTARLAAISENWKSDVAKIGNDTDLTKGIAGKSPIASSYKTPPILPLVRGGERWGDKEELGKVIDDATWAKIAQLHTEDVQLDAGSVTLIASKNPNAWDASRLAMTKVAVENPLLRMMRNFERSISEDTVRNEYVFHRKIHEWFINRTATSSIEALNEKVYTELFLTPSSDPWLGLVPKDTYTALENDGMTSLISTSH